MIVALDINQGLNSFKMSRVGRFLHSSLQYLFADVIGSDSGDAVDDGKRKREEREA